MVSNRSHTLAYSLIGLQQLNLSYKYPPVYWACANLIVDSGSVDEAENNSTSYGKMSVALANIQAEGIKIELPQVNIADFGFTPDEKNNRIIFGLKGVSGVGTDLAHAIIQHRPYTSIQDFIQKLFDTKIITSSKMVQLIKAGCFTELHSPDRTETMEWFLRNHVYTPTDKLSMQQFNRAKELNIIPEELELAQRMVNFKKYVLDDEGFVHKHVEEDKKVPKRGYHDGHYILNEQSQSFFKKHFNEEPSVVGVQGEYYIVSEKQFSKEVDTKIQPLKDWLASDNALEQYNEAIYQSIWDKHASGSLPAWSMQSLSYYDSEHELEHVDEKLYGIVNFFDLPEEPEPYDYYTRYIDGEKRSFPKFKISRIVGTVLNADNLYSTVTLLTMYGTVQVKMSKGHYAFYNKQISEIQEDGTKKIVERSWLKRGNIIAIAGIRRGDIFRPQKYQDTIYKHTVSLASVNPDNTLSLQAERTKLEGGITFCQTHNLKQSSASKTSGSSKMSSAS